MREITENLHRSDLTTLERAEQIEEWRVLMEANPNAQVAHSGGKPQRGISQAAKELGTTRREVERAEKIAKITPEAKEEVARALVDSRAYRRPTPTTRRVISRVGQRAARSLSERRPAKFPASG
jgi:hypothetical protein